MRIRWGVACVAAALWACGGRESESPRTAGALAIQRSSVAASMPRYTIVEIPPLAGDDFANAWGLNDRNQVVSASFRQGVSAVPFLYEPGRGTCPLNATQGAAVAINEGGDIAETAWVCPTSPHALSASVDRTYRDLGTFGDPSGSCNTPLRSEAYAINSIGEIVGCAQKADGSNQRTSGR